MFRLLFLLPVILCAAWWLFLNANNIPLKQGRKGFFYIIIFSLFVLGFFTLMVYITNSDL
ncbi:MULTISPECIES: hypothetical protein [unclassified Pseudoalteromonas]|uniref:hypothetical protein n=1 Tax=unclassified Pseudoalteromonas TaxID=194690 RepID=UPI000CF5E233|nr:MULTISPECIES: hypothetical protein [unclassified Pseudoalteromonas]